MKFITEWSSKAPKLIYIISVIRKISQLIERSNRCDSSHNHTTNRRAWTPGCKCSCTSGCHIARHIAIFGHVVHRPIFVLTIFLSKDNQCPFSHPSSILLSKNQQQMYFLWQPIKTQEFARAQSTVHPLGACARSTFCTAQKKTHTQWTVSLPAAYVQGDSLNSTRMSWNHRFTSTREYNQPETCSNPVWKWKKCFDVN